MKFKYRNGSSVAKQLKVIFERIYISLTFSTGQAAGRIEVGILFPIGIMRTFEIHVCMLGFGVFFTIGKVFKKINGMEF